MPPAGVSPPHLSLRDSTVVALRSTSVAFLFLLDTRLGFSISINPSTALLFLYCVQKEESVSTELGVKANSGNIVVYNTQAVTQKLFNNCISCQANEWWWIDQVHPPETHPHCCFLLQTLRNSPLLLQHHSPVNTNIHHTAHLVGHKPQTLTKALCALICRSISSGLLNFLPPPLWPFFPATQLWDLSPVSQNQLYIDFL